LKTWTLALLIVAFAASGCSRISNAASRRRMIVIGVDGMDPEFLESHWASLPNMDRLRRTSRLFAQRLRVTHRL